MPLLVLMSLILVTETILIKPNRQGATVPGDIIIGGLFAIHEKVKNYTDLYSISPPQFPNCSGFYTSGLTQALAMIHAVEMANRSPMLTSLNITLGYRLRDTCYDVTTALWAVQDFTQSYVACDSSTNSSEPDKPTMAVIGASSSEISIAIARELNLFFNPTGQCFLNTPSPSIVMKMKSTEMLSVNPLQISYASTATILSDKSRFPAFMRTVPNDKHQTRAMVKFLKDRSWNWVGAIITDGDYGRSALESFVSQAAEEGICVAFKEVLPDSLTDQEKLKLSINRTVNTIVKNPKVKVVVSFAKSIQMKMIFMGLNGEVSNKKVWVASDNWSTAKDILKKVNLTDIGDVLGFTFKSGNVSVFAQYLRDLQHNSEDEMNPFLKEFIKQPDVGNITVAVDKLLKQVNSDMFFSVQLAVGAVAKAVAELCVKKQCKNQTTIQPWELLAQLRKVTIEKEGVNYNFDSDGDINLGYVVSIWQETENEVYKSDKIAEYDLFYANFTYTKKDQYAFESVISKCSNTCEPGEFKKTADGQHTCCYECSKCPENQYSNGTDMVQCYMCDKDKEWSDSGSTRCNSKTQEYFEWNSGFAIVLLTLSALGIIFLFMISALFIWKRNSPVVKAAGGPLCHLILASLLGSFVSVVFFVGEPTDMTCKVRQVMFGLSFTLCVSCILVKSLKILLAFQMNFELNELLCKLYKPYMIVCISMAVQVIICALWLNLCSPFKDKKVLLKSNLMECNECSDVAFGVMLGYIVFLALVCFTFAYIGRKLPQKYNDAKFITFGMLIYLMAWVIFIPVHLTTSGIYVPAVEMVVILISNYGILSCHFLPKCYIILFKKEHNTKDAFLKNVYEYARKSAENIRSSSEAEPESKMSNSVYTISNPQLVSPLENVSAPKPDLKVYNARDAMMPDMSATI